MACRELSEQEKNIFVVEQSMQNTGGSGTNSILYLGFSFYNAEVYIWKLF